jgi:hypothetical protein
MASGIWNEMKKENSVDFAGSERQNVVDQIFYFMTTPEDAPIPPVPPSDVMNA